MAGEEMEMERLLFSGYIVSISEDYVLEMDYGDGYITLEMDLNVTGL